MITHYTFIRDWVHGPTDNSPEVIVVEADHSQPDPFADAQARSIKAGQDVYGEEFDDFTMEFLAAQTDISGLLIDFFTDEVIRVPLV